MTRIRLGTGDGVVTLDDSNGTWEQRAHGLGGEPVTVVKAGLGTLFAGTYGHGLHRSRDGGESWERVGADMPMDHIRAITFTRGAVLVGAEPATIIRSSDGGETWEELPLRDAPGSDNWFLPYSPRAGAVRTFARHPDAPDMIYAGVEVGGVFRSKDGGDSWGQTSRAVSADVHSVIVRPDDPETVYAATNDGVYRSRDAGASWQQLSRGYTRGVAIPPDSPDRVIATPGPGPGGASRVIISDDGGDTWTDGPDDALWTTVDYLILHPKAPGLLFAAMQGVPGDPGDAGRLLYTDPHRIDWQVLEPGTAAIRWVDVVDEMA